MFSLLRGLADRIFVVAGALFFAQAPHFFQAYTQRLGGHMAELRLQIGTLSAQAAHSGKSLAEYMHKFATHTDPDISRQGAFMEAMQERFSDLSSAYTAMIEATPLTRPLHFFQYLQFDVVHMTAKDFRFGLSFTLETAIYALVGMGIGYLLFRLVQLLCRLPLFLFRSARVAE